MLSKLCQRVKLCMNFLVSPLGQVSADVRGLSANLNGDTNRMERRFLWQNVGGHESLPRWRHESLPSVAFRS
jgi:hypothetical protein